MAGLIEPLTSHNFAPPGDVIHAAIVLDGRIVGRLRRKAGESAARLYTVSNELTAIIYAPKDPRQEAVRIVRDHPATFRPKEVAP